MSENDKLEHLLDTMSPLELSNKIEKSLDEFYSDEYKAGMFRIPKGLPKEFEDRIDYISLLSCYLNTKLKERENA